MYNFIQSRKNVILLFIAGFFIGILLEIFIIERGRHRHIRTISKPVHLKAANKSESTVTCLILMKHSHDNYLVASKSTWLKYCNHLRVVELTREKKGRIVHQEVKGALCNETSSLKRLFRILSNYNTCERNEAEAYNVAAEYELRDIILGKSGWSALCKALHRAKSANDQWLIIVPDNLLILMDNLKNFVRELNWRKGHYYGHTLKHYLANFNTLMAGILLSHGALNILLGGKFKTEKDCDGGEKYWRNEDIYLGKYLKERHILPQDARDAEGRGRFHGYNIHTLMTHGKLFNQSDYKKKSMYPILQGFNCCSPHLISIDVSGPDNVYHHFYYLYKLNVHHKRQLADMKSKEHKKDDGFSWRDFLREKGYSKEAIENMSQEEYYKIWAHRIPPELLYQKLRNDFG